MSNLETDIPIREKILDYIENKITLADLHGYVLNTSADTIGSIGHDVILSIAEHDAGDISSDELGKDLRGFLREQAYGADEGPKGGTSDRLVTAGNEVTGFEPDPFETGYINCDSGLTPALSDT